MPPILGDGPQIRNGTTLYTRVERPTSLYLNGYPTIVDRSTLNSNLEGACRSDVSESRTKPLWKIVLARNGAVAYCSQDDKGRYFRITPKIINAIGSSLYAAYNLSLEETGADTQPPDTATFSQSNFFAS